MYNKPGKAAAYGADGAAFHEAEYVRSSPDLICGMKCPLKGMMKEMREIVCVSPFKEIKCGRESIYDYVQEGYTVPEKVIAYLRTAKPYIMSPGCYEHPFRPGTRLLGPYMYTDGHYCWDRDTWKYVVKYHVALPQEFIDHVMSDEGSAFIEECIDGADSWSDAIKTRKKNQGAACFLPDNAGNRRNRNMPLVRIEIIEGKSAGYKKQLLQGIHKALVDALQIEDGDRFQRLYELPPESFERNGSKTDKFTLIEITMFPGRTKQQKARVYENITRELSDRLQIEPTDIFIVINEPPNENWGLAGKQRD